MNTSLYPTFPWVRKHKVMQTKTRISERQLLVGWWKLWVNPMSNTSNLFSVGQGHNDTITLTEPYDKSSFFCVWAGHIICSFLITKQLSGVLWSKHNKANMYLPENLQTESCSNKQTNNYSVSHQWRGCCSADTHRTCSCRAPEVLKKPLRGICVQNEK